MEQINKALYAFHQLNVSVTKNARGQVSAQAGYNYADLPHVIDCVRPALIDCGLIVSQRTLFAAPDVILQTSLIHVESGETIISELPIYMDDKPQAFGSRLTYWRRYAYLTILGLAPENEDDDGAAAQHQSNGNHRSGGYDRYQPESTQQQSARGANPPREREREREPGEDHCERCGDELRRSKNGNLYCYRCWKEGK